LTLSEHKLFQVRGRDARSGSRLVAATLFDHAGDVVAVPDAPFDRVGRRHPVATVVEDAAEEECALGLPSGCPLVMVGRELGLDRVEGVDTDVWLVLARMALARTISPR
jgi:hypothetical protein